MRHAVAKLREAIRLLLPAVNCTHMAGVHCALQPGSSATDRGAAHVRAGASECYLRHYLEQGLSKAEIACSLGVSRRTLY